MQPALYLYQIFKLSYQLPRTRANLHVSDAEQPRGNRYRPYTTNQLPSGNGAHSGTRQEDYYGPNQSLFDHESVLDMVSSGVSYDSDCENSDLMECNTCGRAPYSSTPLRERNQQPRHHWTECQCEIQTPNVAMLQEQQQLLQSLIRTQESMKEMHECMKESQSAFECKLLAIQQQVTHLCHSSPSSSEEKKCKVTRELTFCIRYYV